MGTAHSGRMYACMLLFLPLVLAPPALAGEGQGSLLFDGGGTNDLIKMPAYQPSPAPRSSPPPAKIQHKAPAPKAPASRSTLSPGNSMAVGIFGLILQDALSPPKVNPQEQLRLQQQEEARRAEEAARRAEAERIARQKAAERKEREVQQAKQFLDGLNDDPSVVKIGKDHAVVRSLKGDDPVRPYTKLQKIRVPLPGEEAPPDPAPADPPKAAPNSRLMPLSPYKPPQADGRLHLAPPPGETGHRGAYGHAK